jgi:Secretion system C-terminal sorting domain
MSMKKELIVFLFILFCAGAYSQLTLPVYFERPEEDTSWNQFSNGSNEPGNFVLAENPDKSGINPSDFCIMFTVLANADPWVGAYSDAYGDIEITGDHSVMQMMVFKDVISDCDLKLEFGTDFYEVKVPNTETGVWELLSFDFSAVIGNVYSRLTFFPDFPSARTAGSLCYIDNIGFEGTFDFGTSLKEKSRTNFNFYPNPARDKITLQSEGIKQVTITNPIGQTVKTFRFQKSEYEVLDVSDLARGIYFLTVETTAGTVSSKFARE